MFPISFGILWFEYKKHNCTFLNISLSRYLTGKKLGRHQICCRKNSYVFYGRQWSHYADFYFLYQFNNLYWYFLPFLPINIDADVLEKRNICHAKQSIKREHNLSYDIENIYFVMWAYKYYYFKLIMTTMFSLPV